MKLLNLVLKQQKLVLQEIENCALNEQTSQLESKPGREKAIV